MSAYRESARGPVIDDSAPLDDSFIRKTAFSRWLSRLNDALHWKEPCGCPRCMRAVEFFEEQIERKLAAESAGKKT